MSLSDLAYVCPAFAELRNCKGLILKAFWTLSLPYLCFCSQILRVNESQGNESWCGVQFALWLVPAAPKDIGRADSHSQPVCASGFPIPWHSLCPQLLPGSSPNVPRNYE